MRGLWIVAATDALLLECVLLDRLWRHDAWVLGVCKKCFCVLLGIFYGVVACVFAGVESICGKVPSSGSFTFENGPWIKYFILSMLLKSRVYFRWSFRSSLCFLGLAMALGKLRVVIVVKWADALGSLSVTYKWDVSMIRVKESSRCLLILINETCIQWWLRIFSTFSWFWR